MPLKLERPLIVFDMETTGVDLQTDRIVEISMMKVSPGGSQETWTQRINPGMHIPAGATKVHGITDEDVKDSPAFEMIADKLFDYFYGADISGFNVIRFDIPILMAEFKRAGHIFPAFDHKVVDALRIYHKKEPRDLTAAYKFYCNKEHTNAHGAEADVMATYEVILGQIEKYNDIGDTVEELARYGHENMVDFSGKLKYNAEDEVVFAFGKHAGKRVKDEPDYANWMMGADFPADTIMHLRKVFEK